MGDATGERTLDSKRHPRLVAMLETITGAGASPALSPSAEAHSAADLCRIYPETIDDKEYTKTFRLRDDMVPRHRAVRSTDML